MTTRNLTGLLPKREAGRSGHKRNLGEILFQNAFALIQWPWLLRSLYGGTQREKQALLQALSLPENALPHLGSWKADTYLLWRIFAEIEQLRPATTVELGSGATSLIAARALSLNGGGQLHSFDQHEPFIEEMRDWLGEFGLSAEFRHAPLVRHDAGWPGLWYDLDQLPPVIDLLIIDGPPWAIHPFARGAAECLFERLSENGTVLLDDAARPGERIVARRWAKRWPSMSFTYEGAGTKGLLVGRKRG